MKVLIRFCFKMKKRIKKTMKISQILVVKKIYVPKFGII